MRKDLQHTIRSTTIVCVRRGDKIALGGDGQVTFDDTILKSGAKKVRRLFDDKVLAGFAGASADAFTLFEKFEAKLNEFHGNLVRSAVELAKDWRTDRVLRRLEALLIAADDRHSLMISGTGDVIESDDGVMAIGSGGPFAQAAARALLRHTEMGAEEIVREAMKITSEICIYTNDKIVVEVLCKEA